MADEGDGTGPESAPSTPPTTPTAATSTGPTDPWSDPEVARTEIEKLRKESASYRTKVRELEPLAKKAQEADEASKTEMQRAQERAQVAETRAQELELAVLRTEIAARHGLTPAQAKRLTGANEAELDADAEAYAKEIGVNGSKPKTDLKQGARGGPPAPDAEAWLRRLAGRP